MGNAAVLAEGGELGHSTLAANSADDLVTV
jgi:hypothetical protein